MTQAVGSLAGAGFSFRRPLPSAGATFSTSSARTACSMAATCFCVSVSSLSPAMVAAAKTA